MRRLIIVSGISGAGKSYMLEQLAGRSREIVALKKISTRPARNHELVPNVFTDLEYGKSKEEVSVCDFKYNYSGHVYGVKKKDIDKALLVGKSPLVIIRNSQTIRELKEIYKDAIVIYIKSAYSGHDLTDILKKQGRTDIDIKKRLARHRDDLLDYANNIELYDYVFTNLFDDDSLILQFDTAIRLEKKRYPIEHDLLFVLMSFNPELDLIFDEIEDAARLVNENIRVLRIDRKPGDYPISPEILSLIERAKLIVCDLTEEKPNVYYELGYARGKDKTVLHCAKLGTKLHFDVKDIHTIFYHNPTDLRKKLTYELTEYFNKNL